MSFHTKISVIKTLLVIRFFSEEIRSESIEKIMASLEKNSLNHDSICKSNNCYSRRVSFLLSRYN